MKTANLIFPHQLFESSPLLEKDGEFFILEEYLFFRQYKFHKQKIAFHRSSMKKYVTWLISKNLQVSYVESAEDRSDVRKLISNLADEGFELVRYMDPTDNWLQRRITEACNRAGLKTQKLESLLFLNTRNELDSFFEPEKSSFNQTSFYIQERKKREVRATPPRS